MLIEADDGKARKPLTRNEFRSVTSDDWWLHWRESDFSWDELAEKKLNNPTSRAQNLQEWWLLDDRGRPRSSNDLEAIGELVRDPDGALWHIAHVPFAWKNGAKTFKTHWTPSDWETLYNVLTNRLNRAVASDVSRTGVLHGRDGRAQFQGCVLNGLPRRNTEDGSIHANFDDCYFRDPIFIKGVILGAGTSFRQAFFEQLANFSGCLSRGQLTFDRCTFMGPAVFSGAKFEDEVSFSGSVFKSGASFESSTFTCWAFFESCYFNGADFPQSRFMANVSFQNAMFEAAEFGDAVFERQASFDNADFSQSGDLSFWNATFKGDATFVRTGWPDQPAVYAGTFRNAHFQSAASFESPNLHQFAAFYGARFDGTLFIDRASVTSDACFNRAVSAVRDEAQLGYKHSTPTDIGLERLESGLRALKLACERQRDRYLEIRLHQLELTCRRMQSTTPTWERIISWIYGVFALYGNSAGRPLVVLLALWVIGGLAFFVWEAALSASVHWPSLLDALRLSASTIFRPFEGWSRTSIQDASFQSALLDGFGPLNALLVRAAMTFESIAALTLLFLIALGLRRRFQIA